MKSTSLESRDAPLEASPDPRADSSPAVGSSLRLRLVLPVILTSAFILALFTVFLARDLRRTIDSRLFEHADSIARMVARSVQSDPSANLHLSISLVAENPHVRLAAIVAG